MQAARREMAITATELLIRKALSSLVPRNANLVIEIGDLARVFRETDKQWVRPYPVILVDGDHVFIIDYHREVNFNKHQLLPADTYDNIITGEHLVTTLHSSLPKLSSNRPRKYSTLTAMRSQAHSSRRFHIKMILVCEVSKRIEHKSEKLKTWYDVAHGNSFSKTMNHLDRVLHLACSIQGTIWYSWIMWCG